MSKGPGTLNANTEAPSDVFTPQQRSAVMARVKGRDTKPEMVVRRHLHALGYRFRLHRKDLPGAPDLTLASRRKVIFVHGCFWHGHDCPRGARIPKQNRAYWEAKIARNRARDAAALAQLQATDWSAHIIWECALRDPGWDQAVTAFLGPPGRGASDAS